MSIDVSEIGPIPAAWTRRHLLGLEDLSVEELNLILDAAEMFKEATGGCTQKIPVLTGRTCANLFFENSTRTRTSFSLAMRRLGGDTVHCEFVEHFDGRDDARYGPQHRSDGGSSRRLSSPHARHAASAF